MPDRIEETLSALRVDIDRVGLPDSGSIRRRGDRRTRHQVIGTTLAALAVVAGAIGVTANLAGDDRSLQGPPAKDGPTATTSVTEEKLLTLADDPLLRPDDIGTIGVYEGWELNASPDAADQMLSLCVSKPSDLGGTDTVSGLYYNVLDGTFTEHVLRFPDAAAAQDAVDTVARSLTGCTVGTPADDVQTRWAPLDVTAADAAVHVSRSSETPNSEPSYLELGMARTSNVVVLLSWNSMGQPESVSWVWTADRLQSALDRAVG